MLRPKRMVDKLIAMQLGLTALRKGSEGIVMNAGPHFKQ